MAVSALNNNSAETKHLQSLANPTHVALHQLWELQKARAASNRTAGTEWRKTLLKKLYAAIELFEIRLTDAVFQDFGRVETETRIVEIYPLLTEIQFNLKNIEKWTKQHSAGRTIMTLTAKAWTKAEPKGVSLIISPWNYPIFLTLGPLISAIAAGCTAILKTSELTPKVSVVLQELVRDAFLPEEAAVVLGDAQSSQALLDLPFDHIFFTGSTQVGSIIMQRAAQHLSSVTLELGGKSPVIVDETANLKDAAKKVVWAKFVNAGQTCIAPDFVMVHHAVQKRFCEALIAEVMRAYSDKAPHHDLAKIVSERHYTRLKKAVEEAIGMGAEALLPVQAHDEQRAISPTLLLNVSQEALLMREEIFGPVLPIKTYTNMSDLVHYLSTMPSGKPLAMYIFSESEVHQERLLAEVSAGGVCINDCLIHLVHKRLPFGGVNQSGIGKSKGEYGFWEFSNRKAVIKQKSGLAPFSLFFPPYTEEVKKRLDWLFKLKI